MVDFPTFKDVKSNRSSSSTVRMAKVHWVTESRQDETGSFCIGKECDAAPSTSQVKDVETQKKTVERSSG